MNKIYNPDRASWSELLKRPTKSADVIESLVNTVFAAVKSDGDQAVKKYTEQYDRVLLESLNVSETEIDFAQNHVSVELQDAIQMAKLHIEKFHTAQQTPRVEVETAKGILCWQEKKPIQKVGLYIPGGTAPLFSTILMLAVPAQIAGCEEIILCTPPDTSGRIAPAILYTAALCGITRIFKVGGIQAIAAMTFGTETIPQVYKIFGPGNQFVTAAKQLATKFGAAIDMPAGPSELLVVADDSANASFVASDLLSQAEHGADSQVILVATSKEVLLEVEKEIEAQIILLPRFQIAEKAIENSKLIFIDDDQEVIDLVNAYGPEHFIICSRNAEFFIDNVQNAGSVFIGNYTPESAGDYASGTNHTLPTNGYAKQYSGVSLDSFLKSMTFQKITKEGLLKIGGAIEIMAEAEGLQAHKNAITLRLNSLRK